jgi:ArsR family transcriptional regulator
MADIYTAIADSTRRDILSILLERAGAGEITAADLAEQLGVTLPTATKHLGVLREQGFVRVREEGRLRYFCLELAPFDSLQTWLRPFAGPDYGDDVTASAHDDGAESAVFSAWAGTDVASTIGRRLAERRYQAKSAIHDAQERVTNVLPDVVTRHWQNKA